SFGEAAVSRDKSLIAEHPIGKTGIYAESLDQSGEREISQHEIADDDRTVVGGELDGSGRPDRTLAFFLEAVADSNGNKGAIGADVDHVVDQIPRPPGYPKRCAEIVRNHRAGRRAFWLTRVR